MFLDHSVCMYHAFGTICITDLLGMHETISSAESVTILLLILSVAILTATWNVSGENS